MNDIQYADMQLSVVRINSLLRQTSRMLLSSVQLQTNINDSMRKTKAFIRWLFKCVHMVTSPSQRAQPESNPLQDAQNAQSSDSNSAEIQNLTNQDLHLIVEFLKENSLYNGFKFENIAHFLRLEGVNKTMGSKAKRLETEDRTNGRIYDQFAQDYKLDQFIDFLFKLESEESLFSLDEDLNQRDLIRDPLQDLESRNWKSLLSHDGDNLDSLHADLADDVYSLHDHLGLIKKVFDETFRESSSRISKVNVNYLKQAILKKELVYIKLKIVTSSYSAKLDQEFDYFCWNRPRGSDHHFLATISSLDGHQASSSDFSQNVVLFLIHSSEGKSNLIPVMFHLGAATIGSSYFRIEHIQFYDHQYLTMILSGHLKFSATGAPSSKPQQKDQFLFQFGYQSFCDSFDQFPSSSVQLSEINSETQVEPVLIDLSKHFVLSNPDSSLRNTTSKIDFSLNENDLQTNWIMDSDNLVSRLLTPTNSNDGDQTKLSVSGTRSVACLINGAGNKVTIYEMDDDEDEHEASSLMEADETGRDVTIEDVGLDVTL